MAASKLEENVAELQKKIAGEATKFVSQLFPEKILALTELFQNTPDLTMNQIQDSTWSSPIACCPVHEVRTNPSSSSGPAEITKKRRLESSEEGKESGPCVCKDVKSNQTILDLMEKLKKEIMILIGSVGTVKMWIQLHIPKMEDGNNFGVSVQEELVGELGRAEESCFGILESMTKYFLSRGKIVSKTYKYPHVSDYVRSIKELDEKEYISLKLCVLDLRNNYCLLHDLLKKNSSKITQPRGSSNPMNNMY